MIKHRLLFVFGLAVLFTGLLAAQDAPPTQEARAPGPGPGPQFAQGIGAQYDSKLGFVPSYRVELTAPLVRNPGLSLEVKVSNDFAVLADKLDASLAANFRPAQWLTFALATPASVTYRVPGDLSGQVAGSAKLAIGNNQGAENRSVSVPSGWVLAGELSSTASAIFGNLPSGQGILYQTAGQLEVGYQFGVVSPNLKLAATADLGTFQLTDVTSRATLNFSWDRFLGSVSLGASQLRTSPVLDYNIGIGYLF